jgi:hypothetical protein
VPFESHQVGQAAGIKRKMLEWFYSAVRFCSNIAVHIQTHFEIHHKSLQNMDVVLIRCAVFEQWICWRGIGKAFGHLGPQSVLACGIGRLAIWSPDLDKNDSCGCGAQNE